MKDLYLQLTFLDYFIFSLVIFITYLSVKLGLKNKKENNFLEYLLMGRQLTLPLFVASLVSTWYGGIFGVTEIAYNQGIYNFFTQGFFWYCSYLFMAFFLVKRINLHQSKTLPELISKIAGKKSGQIAAVLNLFNVIPITYTISIGLFISALFGMNFLTSMFIGVSIVLLYSLWSGFRGIIYSDVIQFFVMCGSVLMILALSISTYGGLDFLKVNLPETYFSLKGSSTWLETISWGFIAITTLIDPNFYQRIFAAKNSDIAKRGILISTGIWIVFDLCTTFGAMYAKAAMPNLDSKTAYLEYALHLVPSPLKGFILAGILATILSTLDSYLFLAGNTLSFDILKLNTKKIHHHKLSMLLISVISVFLSIFFEGNIKSVWKLMGSLGAASTLIPVLLSLYKPRFLTDDQFSMASMIGAISVLISHYFSFSLDSLYIGMLSCSFSIFAIKLIKR